VFSRHIRTLSKIGIFAGTLSLTASPRDTVKPYSVYHNGADIVFAPEAAGTRKVASFGPWNLGERLGDDKPLDNRLNLYVVIPGSQYHSSHSEYDHNLIVNKYLVDGKARDWDIFWCFILDPSLRPDLRSERELLMAKQETFRPAALFDIKDVPSHVLMAMGVRPELAHGSLRLSLGRASTAGDVDYVLEVLPPIVERLRSIAPAASSARR